MEESSFKSSLQIPPAIAFYKYLNLLQSHFIIPPSPISKNNHHNQAAMPAMAFCECKNKENIHPFSSNQSNPVLGITPSSAKKFKRKFRKPLADITNLVNSFPQSAASASYIGSHLPPSVSVCGPNSKKRKAVGDADLVQSTLFKTMRRDFR